MHIILRDRVKFAAIFFRALTKFDSDSIHADVTRTEDGDYRLEVTNNELAEPEGSMYG